MNEDMLNVMGNFSETALDCIEKQNEEIEQLKRDIKLRNENIIAYKQAYEKYKSVLDEIREFIKKCSFSIEGITNEYHDIVYAEDIEEILDKVKE